MVSKLPPGKGSVALRQLNPIHKKEPQSFQVTVLRKLEFPSSRIGFARKKIIQYVLVLVVDLVL